MRESIQYFWGKNFDYKKKIKWAQSMCDIFFNIIAIIFFLVTLFFFFFFFFGSICRIFSIDVLIANYFGWKSNIELKKKLRLC